MLDRRSLLSGASLIVGGAPGDLFAQETKDPVGGVAAAIAPTLLELAPTTGKLRAQVAPEIGGILAGLQYQLGGTPVELLYRGLNFASSKGWGGKAPILWPAVGVSAANASGIGLGRDLEPSWTWKGRTYPMPMHGFAMREQWKVEEVSSGEETAHAIITLTDNVTTRKMYPFGFKLTVQYRVSHTTATVHYRVAAARENGDPMPFSAGNHITFNVPFIPTGRADAVTITSSARRQVLLRPDKTPSGEIIPVDYTKPRPLSSLGVQTPVSLGECPAGEIWARLEDPAGLAITISHQSDWRPAGEPVLFNLWGNVPEGFFAPEPWLGKQNSLVTGDGLIHLPPGEEFNWRIAIDIS